MLKRIFKNKKVEKELAAMKKELSAHKYKSCEHGLTVVVETSGDWNSELDWCEKTWKVCRYNIASMNLTGVYPSVDELGKPVNTMIYDLRKLSPAAMLRVEQSLTEAGFVRC